MAADDVVEKTSEEENESHEEERQHSRAENGGPAHADSSGLRRALKAGVIAAAAGTTAAAAAKALGTREGGERERHEGGKSAESRTSRVRGAASKASKRGEPFLAVGWDAAKDSLLPLAESAARAAGRFTAEHSPELIRDRLIPPFIEAFTQTRKRDAS